MHFYNKNGTNYYFVSRYSLDEIRQKYREIDIEYIDNLIECKLEKNNDKEIYFSRLDVQRGGNLNYNTKSRIRIKVP